MPHQPTYRRHVLAHLGLVAGMLDELGIGDVLNQAAHQNPAMWALTVGEAVQAMVLNGLGFSNHALYRVSRVFPNRPASRLLAPVCPPSSSTMTPSVAPWILFLPMALQSALALLRLPLERLGLAQGVAWFCGSLDLWLRKE